jgi:hypothetical protein
MNLSDLREILKNKHGSPQQALWHLVMDGEESERLGEPHEPRERSMEGDRRTRTRTWDAAGGGEELDEEEIGRWLDYLERCGVDPEEVDEIEQKLMGNREQGGEDAAVRQRRGVRVARVRGG